MKRKQLTLKSLQKELDNFYTKTLFAFILLTSMSGVIIYRASNDRRRVTRLENTTHYKHICMRHDVKAGIDSVRIVLLNGKIQVLTQRVSGLEGQEF